MVKDDSVCQLKITIYRSENKPNDKLTLKQKPTASPFVFLSNHFALPVLLFLLYVFQFIFLLSTFGQSKKVKQSKVGVEN